MGPRLKRRCLLLILAAFISSVLIFIYLHKSDNDVIIHEVLPEHSTEGPFRGEFFGFNRIAHFGAKPEDIRRNEDFWRHPVRAAEEHPKVIVHDGKAFGDVAFFGGETSKDNTYPMKGDSHLVRQQPTQSQALDVAPITERTTREKPQLNPTLAPVQPRAHKDVPMQPALPVIEDIYPLKARGNQSYPTRAPPPKAPPPVDLNYNQNLSLAELFTPLPRLDGENIVAMSLYGSDRRYTTGALRNAALVKQHFPGWTLRVYVEAPSDHPRYGLVPSNVLSGLREAGAQVHFMQPGEDYVPPMMWRFLVADDLWVEHFIVRDADARLLERDAAAVGAWVRSGAAFHCVRDHPSHAGFAISGGMWGGRPKALRDIMRRSWRDMMRGIRETYLEDMNFLNYVVWPRVRAHAYCSDSVSCQVWPSAHPFPVPRLGYEHVGQVYNEHDLGRPQDIQILRAAGENPACVPRLDIKQLLQRKDS